MTTLSSCFEKSPDYAGALGRAAALHGVEQEYWDIWGNRHGTSPEVQKAILEALGMDCSSLEAIDGALEERLWREWSSPVEPALVLAQDAAAPVFLLTVPSGMEQATAAVEVRWEDGSRESYELKLEDLPVVATAQVRGRLFARHQAPLPRALRFGYHDLEVTVRAAAVSVRGMSRLIVGPGRTWCPPELKDGGRAAGVAIALYGVRSSRNWGCGDFTDLERVIDWVADEVGGSFVSLNPLHSIANRQPFNTSPYLPNSVLYRNAIYVDVERVAEFQESARARALFESPEVQVEIRALRQTELVEYERVYSLKLRLLRLAFETFLERAQPGDGRAAEFEQYCAAEGEFLERYATYCALDAWIHERDPGIWIWPQWPQEYQDPGSGAVREFAREHRDEIQFQKYLQWVTEIQLAETQQYARRRGLPIGLYHDLALATDRCGSDLWANRGYFATGCRVGAPPDSFSPKGQDWGFPPPNTQHHRETGYRLFAETIRQNCRYGGALRIDHVMRFFRLFWIPGGVEPLAGAYVRDYPKDLLRIVALESMRQKVLIVGEDLGTVEPAFREELARFGILSYRLLYFEKNERGECRLPEEYPRQALVSATTHDLPTLAGFWLGRDIEARRAAGLLGGDDVYRSLLADRGNEKQKLLDALTRLGLLPGFFPRRAADVPELTGEIHNALTGFLASTPSMLMVLNQEDLLKETEQQNLPGSTWQYPNWRRKTRFSVEELKTSPAAGDFTRMFRRWLERTGRLR